MKNLFALLIIGVISVSCIWAQDQNVGIGTLSPDVNAKLDITSNEKGLLIPRLTTAQRDGNITGIGLAQEGLLIYNTTTDKYNYWDGNQWIEFPGGGSGGATGPTGPTGADGNDGANGLIEATAIGPGVDCPDGGYMIEEGLDANNNGIIDLIEIELTFYVCNGADGSGGGTGGTTGPTGPAGPQGPTGTNGADGATGPPGTNGINGVDGATGPTGTPGTNGINGTNGADGATGPTGPSGPTVVSADAGNAAGLGTDGYIYVVGGTGGADTDWTIAGTHVYKATGTASIGTSSFGTWPLNVINANVFRRSINILQDYTGSQAADALYVRSNNNAAVGGAITRGLYSQAEKAATSGSTGEVQAATHWGINRYGGASFSDAKGTVSLGYKYDGANGDAFGLIAEGFNELGTTAYGIFASTSGSPTTKWSAFLSGDAWIIGVWNPSDELLKNQIKKYDSSLDKLMSLQVSSYQYNTDKYKFMNLPEGEQVGFISHELGAVFPELVKATRHPGPTKASVEAGINAPHDPVEFQSVNYIGLIPHLTRALQEQQAIILQKDQEIEALRQRLDSIEDRLDQLEE